MIKFKYILVTLIFILIFSNLIHAQETCILELTSNERNKFIISEKNENRLIELNKNSYYEEDNATDMRNFTDDNDDVFESKCGKIFAKFIDDKIINNKFTDIPSKLNQQQSFQK